MVNKTAKEKAEICRIDQVIGDATRKMTDIKDLMQKHGNVNGVEALACLLKAHIESARCVRQSS